MSERVKDKQEEPQESWWLSVLAGVIMIAWMVGEVWLQYREALQSLQQ